MRCMFLLRVNVRARSLGLGRSAFMRADVRLETKDMSDSKRFQSS